MREEEIRVELKGFKWLYVCLGVLAVAATGIWIADLVSSEGGSEVSVVQFECVDEDLYLALDVGNPEPVMAIAETACVKMER